MATKLPLSVFSLLQIYPSEYGMKRMAEEETHGPRGVWKDEEDDGEKEGIEDADEAQEEVGSNNEGDADEKKAWRGTSILNRRRLRRYQLQRLKYFYAIAEFDNKETAGAVYEACDGVEYASTGVRFDLRFVSDEETFSVSCFSINRWLFITLIFVFSAPLPRLISPILFSSLLSKSTLLLPPPILLFLCSANPSIFLCFVRFGPPQISFVFISPSGCDLSCFSFPL